MKRMALVFSIVACLVACDNKPATTGTGTNTSSTGTGTGTPKETPKEAPKGFEYDMWESWNSFAEGSSVVVEMTKPSAMKTTTTIKKKEADKITVTDEMEMGGNKMPGNDRVIEKPKKVEAPTECPACKKPVAGHKKPDMKETKGKVKVGDKEVDAVTIDMTAFDCEGKEVFKSTTSYSKDVPGWTVKTVMATMESAAVSFTKK